MDLTYVLPIADKRDAPPDLDRYLNWLADRVELIVIDGRDVDADLKPMLNGKVAGVLTGVRRATHEHIVIADDDVRYGEQELEAMDRELATADVVRPQNYFDPMPWHACLDTGRTLINRMTGGDWPGTLGVRRSVLETTRGYCGDVMFENLELVRTVVAAGGRESCPLGLFVRREPPTADHFWSQRVRQAYDEFARPARMLTWLAVLPVTIALVATRRWTWLAAAAAAVVGLAECGRVRAGGSRVFPFRASLAAPLWLCERAICSWLAVGARLALGGIPYRGRVIARACSAKTLAERG